MASPCCKRAVSIWLKFCRGIPFSATATVVGRKTYHFSFTCGRGQFLQIWKGNLLFSSSTCGRGQDRLGLRRSLQTHLRSPKQRSPSSVPANGFSNEKTDIFTLSQNPHWRMPCTLGKLNISRKKSSTATACSAWVNYEGQGKDVGLRIHVFH